MWIQRRLLRVDVMIGTMICDNISISVDLFVLVVHDEESLVIIWAFMAMSVWV